MKYWVSAFHISHAKFYEYNKVTNRTVRIVIPNNVNGSHARILLSNLYGIAPAKIGAITVANCDATGKIDPATSKRVTMNGNTEMIIPVSEERYTDSVDFQTEPNGYVAVSMYFPEQERITSGGNIGKYGIRSFEGDHTLDISIDADVFYETYYNGEYMEFDVDTPIPLFKSLDLQTDEKVLGLTVFGDSITAMTYWTKPLAERIYANYPGKVACGNSGIAGNRLLDGSLPIFDNAMGDSALNRFEKDVLNISGITNCIVALGTNDIGYPGAVDSEAVLPTVDEMLAGYQSLVERAHAKDIRMTYLAIFPRKDVQMTPEKEELRKKVNDAVCDSNIFDNFISMDEALCEPGSCVIADENVLEDGLHLSVSGGKIVAGEIEVEAVLSIK